MPGSRRSPSTRIPQVPTGEVIINMADGTEKQMYVTDVNEVEQLLRQSGIDGYNVTDVAPRKIFC